MLRDMREHRFPAAQRVALVLAAVGMLALLGGCGSSLRGSDSARADVDLATSSNCAATVLEALGHVASRVYREGIASERTATAQHLVSSSAALRTAVEEDSQANTRAAALALLATAHITNLRIVRAGEVLADVGAPAVAPLDGTITDAHGKPIASFVTSVWTDAGLLAETSGIAEGVALLRTDPAAGTAQMVAGSFALPSGELPPHGTLTHNGASYAYTSFPAAAYPAGEPLREFLLRPISSTGALCGSSDEATTVDTVSHIARLIYEGEAGRRTLTQIHRVQQDPALLHAVATRDKAATRVAIEALLNQHVVRLRVSAGGTLLGDVGGPFVLAPVSAPLRLGGRTIGSIVLSIQDDEGYKRLAGRLAGLDVLMYMGQRLVKSTLGPSPGPIPASGRVRVHGKTYRAYTFHGKAFPSGPLRITVLIPLPYF